jgi:hypothetical protein
MSVHDKFFPTSRWSEDSILNQVVEGAVGEPQVIVVVTTAVLLNNKILQQNLVGIQVVEVNPPPTLDTCFFTSLSHQNVTAATSVVATSA